MNIDNTAFETEHFKLAKKLYAKYGFELRLKSTKKHDKFWAECNHPILGSCCMCGTSKYPSVDTVAEYEVFGHKTHNKPAAEKWCNEHECGGDGYFGCQVPFVDKIESIKKSYAYWIAHKPDKWSRQTDAQMKLRGSRDHSCECYDYYTDPNVSAAITSFPIENVSTTWDGLKNMLP